MLRPRSELWVAQRFAGLPAYHPSFRSCNRAFHIDPGARRLDTGAAQCDKCCFIDLILAPVPGPRRASPRSSAGASRWTIPASLERFRALLGGWPIDQALRVRGRRRASAGPPRCIGGRSARPRRRDIPRATGRRARPGAATRTRGPTCCARWAPSTYPRCLRARRSPGLTCRRPRRRLGARASRARPTSRLLAEWRRAGPRRRPPAARTTSRGCRSSPPPRAGWTSSPRCDVVVKTPGISRYRPDVAAPRRHGVPVVGGLGLWLEEVDPRPGGLHHRHQGQEHDRRRSAGTCSTGSGYGVPGGRQHRPAPLRPDGAGSHDLDYVGRSRSQLPGHRPGVLAPRGGGHLARPRPPRLARRRRDLLPPTSCRSAPSPVRELTIADGRRPPPGPRAPARAPVPLGGAGRPPRRAVGRARSGCRVATTDATP